MGSDAPDGGSRHALIVAAGRYEDGALGSLRSPSKDAEELTDVLEDPAIGGYDVRQLLDLPDYVLRMQIEDFFADARPQDMLLLYLSCHGVKDEAGHLHFATVNTRANRLASTGISADFVYQQVDRCRSRKIVLLLDCCYSGAYARGHRPRANDDASLGRPEGKGWAVITSSTALEYAFEIDSGKVSWSKVMRKAVPSVFTSAVVEGLRTGAADLNRDGLISFDELYEYVWASVRQRTPHQTPVKKWGDVRGDIIIARNPHRDSPVPAVRAGVSDGTLVGISGRQAMLGTVIAAAAAGISFTGWELNQGGRGTAIWRFVASNSITKNPLVAGGTVYVLNDDSTLYALHAADGRKLWEYPAGGTVPGTFAVEDGIAYGHSSSGHTYVLDASDGTVLWSLPGGGIASSPADGVMCVVDYSGKEIRGLSVGAGTKIWHTTISGNVAQDPVVADGIAYVSSGNGEVHALRAGDGSIAWRASAGTGGIASLTVTGGTVYASSDDGYLYALRASDGRRIWLSYTGDSVTPAVVGDRVYIAAGGFLYALSVHDGAKLWEASTGNLIGTEPLIAGRSVCVSANDRDINAFSASRGQRKWTFRTGGEVLSPPAAEEGCVYFGSYDHNLYALRTSDGVKVWSFATGGQISASPAAADGVIYAASMDGSVYALRA